jgi:hypothetical protein
MKDGAIFHKLDDFRTVAPAALLSKIWGLCVIMSSSHRQLLQSLNFEDEVCKVGLPTRRDPMRGTRRVDDGLSFVNLKINDVKSRMY